MSDPYHDDGSFTREPTSYYSLFPFQQHSTPSSTQNRDAEQGTGTHMLAMSTQTQTSVMIYRCTGSNEASLQDQDSTPTNLRTFPWPHTQPLVGYDSLQYTDPRELERWQDHLRTSGLGIRQLGSTLDKFVHPLLLRNREWGNYNFFRLNFSLDTYCDPVLCADAQDFADSESTNHFNARANEKAFPEFAREYDQMNSASKVSERAWCELQIKCRTQVANTSIPSFKLHPFQVRADVGLGDLFKAINKALHQVPSDSQFGNQHPEDCTWAKVAQTKRLQSHDRQTRVRQPILLVDYLCQKGYFQWLVPRKIDHDQNGPVIVCADLFTGAEHESCHETTVPQLCMMPEHD